MQVLVVDDNEIDCLTTGSFVEKANMNLLVANDPYSALEIIANQEITPEIIVVDWIMPKMNGLELCQKIRELKFTITPYIIMVTSNSLGENEQNALDVGADDFIEKPIHGAIFMSRLRVGARIIDLQKKLLSLAHTDELTGLLNRRAAIAACKTHLSRLARTEVPLSHCLIISDIDFFKKINDTYGHEMGDRVLVDVSKRLRNSLRPFETVARFGGEEFLLYCEANEKEIKLILERMRKAICTDPYTLNDVSLNLTMSFGCIVIEQNDTHHDINEFIKTADSLLYEVKNAGRDNFKVATFASMKND